MESFGHVQTCARHGAPRFARGHERPPRDTRPCETIAEKAPPGKPRPPGRRPAERGRHRVRAAGAVRHDVLTPGPGDLPAMPRVRVRRACAPHRMGRAPRDHARIRHRTRSGQTGRSNPPRPGGPVHHGTRLIPAALTSLADAGARGDPEGSCGWWRLRACWVLGEFVPERGVMRTPGRGTTANRRIAVAIMPVDLSGCAFRRCPAGENRRAPLPSGAVR